VKWLLVALLTLDALPVDVLGHAAELATGWARHKRTS
jgi:hypothetical protein